ncbi:MAG: DUF4097 family beta strand repeat-containing protein, partial [Longimicrobiales bacterium]
MMGTLGTALVAALLLPQQVDTTVAVREGTRLQVDLQHGAVTVGTWERDGVRVVYDERGGRPIEVRSADGAVVVRERVTQPGGNRDRRVGVTVPSWMPVRISTQHGDVRVDGTAAEVVVSTVHGSIAVRGGRELVSATSVQGSVIVDGARGRVEAESVNQGVRVEDVQGDVRVTAVNGGIVLQNVTGRTVSAETVNGGVQFTGPLLDGGHYRLASHNGSIVLTLPRSPSARIDVATYNGEFVSDVPIQLSSV